ncbi:MAG: helix-turn-helix domain-containing protein [Clostridium sp.]|uniref:helix-turn-helix domain-containing protein n=1 Tax=Clostridium sp. TaxID=1506 RepID=UPI00290283B5|nr:helix-turn-helix domain-containing protein [Clostridium sp.]MDU1602808.1 helix-turn-helix domain-containing protein [Clostridium sp.]
MKVGENIRKLRKNKKLTLKDLGLKVDLSEQAIGQYERGDRTPNLEILNKIAEALDVSIFEFLSLEDGNGLVDNGDGTMSEVNLRKRALDSIGYILSYASDEGKIGSYTLFNKETESILEATINNIVAITKIINNISFEERLKIYGESED